MELAITDDETFYALHAESNLSMLTETDSVWFQAAELVDPWILDELDELIESEGGLLIP